MAYPTAPLPIYEQTPTVPYPTAPEPALVEQEIPYPTAPEPGVVVVEEPPVTNLKKITDVTLTSSNVSTASVLSTFGLPFVDGQVDLKTEDLYVVVDSKTLDVQVDSLSSFASGKTRYAVVSAELSNVSPSSSKTLSLYSGPKRTSLSETFPINGWDYSTTLTISGTQFVASGKTALLSKIQDSKNFRFNGPIVKEVVFTIPFVNQSTLASHPHLTATYVVRFDKRGNHRTDVIIENTKTFASGIKNYTYDVVIKNGSTSLYTEKAIVHYVRARWHKLFYGTDYHKTHVKYDVNYLISTKAVLNYDTSLVLDKNLVSSMAAQVAASNTKPMQPSIVQPYFPMTGSRDDIAILPKWSAVYLLTQDSTAMNTMLSAADAAGGPGIHYRDDKTTGLPIDAITYPSIMVRYPDISNPSFAVSNDTTVWEPDRAHQPSFAYLPYLVTGDFYYLEETQFWASWNIAYSDDGTREKSRGLIYYDQIRAQAWALRSITEAAFVTPDSHPLKKYFTSVLTNNLGYFANSSNYSPLGCLNIKDYPGDCTPWQQDFVALVLAWNTENKETNAKNALDLINKYQIGRFINTQNGFCYKKAMCYDVKSMSTTGAYITTWKDMFARNFPTYVGVTCANVPLNEEAYPSDTSGMSAMARASLAASSNLGYAGADDAYAIQASVTTELDPGFKYNPAWAIVPKK